jgi:hypothetical protein
MEPVLMALVLKESVEMPWVQTDPVLKEWVQMAWVKQGRC